MTNFVRRTITGAFIVIFIMGGLWLHPVSFFITGAIMIAGTQYEYYVIIRNGGARPQLIAGMATGLLLYLISTAVAAEWLGRESYLILIPALFLVMLTELLRKSDRPFDSLAHTFFSVIYTAVPVSLFPFAAFNHAGIEPLVTMNGVGFSPGILLGFFILLWTNDTGAYLTGSWLGRHRLLERISPKKTWEGFFGGLILAVIVARLISGWLDSVSATGWMIIAVIISVTGTIGDLVESMLKRSLGVKDSGRIMPGHGGFLDRFDSVVVSFPMVYLFMKLAA